MNIPRSSSPLVLVAAAAAVNAALLAAGRAAGASFVVPARGRADAVMQIGIVPVLASTLLPLAGGLLVAALVARRLPRALVALRTTAAVVTVASLVVPLSTDTDAGTRVVLAVMHLVVGAAFLAATRTGRSDASTGVEPVSGVLR